MVSLTGIVGEVVPLGQEFLDVMLVPQIVERLATEGLLPGMTDHGGSIQLV